jgi:hypothetical protein
MQTILIDIEKPKQKKMLLDLFNGLDIPYKVIPKLKPKQQKIIDTEISDVKVDSSKVGSSKSENEDISHPKRLSKKDLYEKICSLCTDDYKSIEEIAKEINRKADYLKNKVFPEMIEKGFIERLHPNITHPHQAYKVTEKS